MTDKQRKEYDKLWGNQRISPYYNRIKNFIDDLLKTQREVERKANLKEGSKIATGNIIKFIEHELHRFDHLPKAQKPADYREFAKGLLDSLRVKGTKSKRKEENG